MFCLRKAPETVLPARGIMNSTQSLLSTNRTFFIANHDDVCGFFLLTAIILVSIDIYRPQVTSQLVVRCDLECFRFCQHSVCRFYLPVLGCVRTK